MAKQLTADDARQSLTSHVAEKGAEICAKYGPHLGWTKLQLLLQDRACVRYPCEIKFDASSLDPGEFAHPVPKSDAPEDGFTMHVHPVYLLDLARVPYLVLYQLVTVNYGEFAAAEEAEVFGANALGISRDEYYDTLCELADRLGAGDLEVAGGAGGDARSGCGCTAH